MQPLPTPMPSPIPPSLPALAYLLTQMVMDPSTFTNNSSWEQPQMRLPTQADITQTTIDLRTLENPSSAVLPQTYFPNQLQSSNSNSVINEIGPTESEDILMRDGSIPPQLFDLDHQSFEEPQQPPSYFDVESMQIDNDSQELLAQSPPGGHTGSDIETDPQNAGSTKANDPHRGTISPGTGEWPRLSPVSPGTDGVVEIIDSNSQEVSAESAPGGRTESEIETDPQDVVSTKENNPSRGTESPGTGKRPRLRSVSPGTDGDESMAPPKEKYRRLTAPNRKLPRHLPAPNRTIQSSSRRHPASSHRQGVSHQKKAVKSKPQETGPLSKSSTFDEMKEVVMRDLNKEYVCRLHVGMFFTLICA